MILCLVAAALRRSPVAEVVLSFSRAPTPWLLVASRGLWYASGWLYNFVYPWSIATSPVRIQLAVQPFLPMAHRCPAFMVRQVLNDCLVFRRSDLSVVFSRFSKADFRCSLGIQPLNHFEPVNPDTLSPKPISGRAPGWGSSLPPGPQSPVGHLGRYFVPKSFLPYTVVYEPAPRKARAA